MEMDSNKDERSSKSSSQSECSGNCSKWDPIEFWTDTILDSGAFGSDANVNGYQCLIDRYKLNKLLPMCMDEIKNEITLLHKMNHLNIVRCYTSWEDFDTNCDNNMYYYIQMELCDRDLRQVIRLDYLYDDQILLRSYTNQILNGLNYIHETIKISHGDLKPENILIKGDRIKIGDFGYAVNLDHLTSENYSEINSENCEIPSGASAYTSYEGMGKSTKSDMYSFGVILFEMCNPQFKNTKQALEELRENVHNPIIPTIIHDDYNDLYLKFIEQLIGRIAKDRPSAKYLLNKIPELVPKTFVQPKQLSSASSTQSDDGSECDDVNIVSPIDNPLLTKILFSTRFNENYKIIKHLTTGNYGAIFKAKNYINNAEYAIKIMRLDNYDELSDESD